MISAGKKQDQNNGHLKTKCAKGFVNGPCGGFMNGKCETNRTKDCVWVLIYEKLKDDKKLEEFLNKYVKP